MPARSLALLVAGVTKRLLVGRPMRSERLRHTLLPKRIALPVFASDALSSVAYAPDEIFLTLSLAGITAYAVSPWVGVAVALVMLTVVTSYGQNVRAYPSGGGDYEVATVNLGRTAGLTVAAALLVDYVLTVAVSISSAAQYAAAAIPSLEGHEVLVAVLAVAVLMTMNLRGVRESGTTFAVPTYLFIVAVLAMVLWGLARAATGTLPRVQSAGLELVPSASFDAGLVGLAGGFLVLRAFSSGCAALTGVEAISNGVPAFKEPKSRNAATTLLLLGALSVTMLLSIVLLANTMGLRYAEDPHEQLLLDGVPVGEDYDQDPVIGQIAHAVFDHFPPAFFLVTAVTGLILVLAANTAFNGFPVLGSILARDGFLPRQLHTRGDRLAFSNGIVALAGGAVVLIVAFDAEVTRLIQLYIVGVFVSFTMSQAGMLRHWTRLLRLETRPPLRKRMRRSRIINGVGLAMTGLVLVIVLVTKFTHGAWIAVLAMVAVFLLMRAIARHYDRVLQELTPPDTPDEMFSPSRVHALVVVSRMHQPTLRALAYARATRPDSIEAVTVAVDPQEARLLADQWKKLALGPPLTVLPPESGGVTRPVIDHIHSIRRAHPDDLVVVHIPEYVVGRWWEHFLHNHSALRLKVRLRDISGVVIASAPWQLASVHRLGERSLPPQ